MIAGFMLVDRLCAIVVTTLGDASCSIFLLFNVLSGSFGLPLWVISGGYICITAAMTVALLICWSMNMEAFDRCDHTAPFSFTSF